MPHSVEQTVNSLGGCCCCLFLLLVGLFYFITLSRALELTSPGNRLMEPPLVWLQLIPLFGIYWSFVTVRAVSKSLKNECIDRDLDDGTDYGEATGNWFLLIGLASSALSLFAGILREPAISFLSVPIAILSLILMLAYWGRIARYRKLLEADNIRRVEEGDDIDDENE